jgi:glutamyl-tRNA synthetase
VPTVRVRFAPSPTGFLHVGGLRTALYNYLYARQNNGVLVLRIEDTDRSRYVEGSVDNLKDTLHWAGINFDEGPGREAGGMGPYIQSERLGLYKEHVEKLVRDGTAYYAFDTPEELEEMRRAQEHNHVTSRLHRKALELSPSQVKEKLNAGVPAVVRMRIPDDPVVGFDDIVRGRVEIAGDQLDDQILFKSDGYPTYHLANVVDDHLMGITHVIRGEEWLPSAPKHVLLYRFFGWDPPRFAHLPLLLNPDRSKLSKRQGDVAVEEYRKKGFLPEALVNFVALLGWNPGDERELFTLQELVREFSLERVGKSGAIFNVEKLLWLNEQHLRKKPDRELLVMLKAELAGLPANHSQSDDAYLLGVIGAMRERMSFVHDIVEKSPYFFHAPEAYDPDTVRKRWKPDSARNLRLLMEKFSRLEAPSGAAYEEVLHRTAEAAGIKNADLIHPLRLALTGVGGGPGVFDILSILGKEESLRRIARAVEQLQ